MGVYFICQRTYHIPGAESTAEGAGKPYLIGKLGFYDRGRRVQPLYTPSDRNLRIPISEYAFQRRQCHCVPLNTPLGRGLKFFDRPRQKSETHVSSSESALMTRPAGVWSTAVSSRVSSRNPAPFELLYVRSALLSPPPPRNRTPLNVDTFPLRDSHPRHRTFAEAAQICPAADSSSVIR